MTDRSRAMKLGPWVALAVATFALGKWATGAITEAVGHPAGALDDSYIHFQYARAIAEGHPFRYQAGEPISTGATSLAWSFVLAIPCALGLRGESILWAAWILSFIALAGVAYETFALARPLCGAPTAATAGAMTLFFGGLVWCAASGMEVVPFAWLVAHGTRRVCEWTENDSGRTPRRFLLLSTVAIAAPLVRPEGSITSLLIAVGVFAFPRVRDHRGRVEPLVFVLAAFLPNAIFFALTGRATTTTAAVKLLAGNPYFPLVESTIANARLLATTILNGGVWSAEFLPPGGAILAGAGLVALLYRGNVSKQAFRSIAIVLFALSIFVPCLYVTFLWNRLRYLWPFAPAWFVGIACFFRVVADGIAKVLPPARWVSVPLGAAVALVLALRLDWVVADVAQSASGIDRQQVALGRWVDESLPRDARVGVNDTGAIAYFGNRRTFDVVGLTTASEGPYWVAGAGSRFEHYERLRATSPALLPTHFVVYPEWMNCDVVLGRVLTERTVLDSSILGGPTMRAYEARWDALGSGELPWSTDARVIDAVDVADLESERAHGYELLEARDGEQVVTEGSATDGSDGHVVADGGRTRRFRDRFVVRAESKPTTLIARVAFGAASELRVNVGGKELGKASVDVGPWSEVAVALPADTDPQIRIEVNADSTFTSFHYWIVELR